MLELLCCLPVLGTEDFAVVRFFFRSFSIFFFNISRSVLGSNLPEPEPDLSEPEPKVRSKVRQQV